MSSRKQHRARRRKVNKATAHWFDNVYRDLNADEVDYVMGPTYYRVAGIPEDEVTAIRAGKYKAKGAARLAVSMISTVNKRFAYSKEGPRVLYNAVQAGEISGQKLQFLLAPVWNFAINPGTLLANDQWTWLYRTAGYLDLCNYGQDAPESVCLYRGAVPGTERNHAWSTSRTMAEAFARKFAPEARVYEVTAPADHLLAHYPHAEIGDEWIVDTCGLSVEEASPQFTTRLVYSGIAPAELLKSVKTFNINPKEN